MKKASFIIFSIAILLGVSCTKQEQQPVEIIALIDGSSTKISYSESGSGDLSQAWEVGDCLIGWCSDKRFSYRVKAVSGGAAYLTWDAGDKLTGTESNVYMYYAPGHSYTDISSGALQLDISSQTADGALKAPMAACGSFSNGSLTLSFSNLGSILRIDRLCWLPENSTVSGITISGAVSSATLAETSLSGGTSSAISLTKEGGWSTNAYGEVTDTLRVALLPSASTSTITIQAFVEGAAYNVYSSTFTVASGTYYYPSTIAARMVSDGKATYYTDFDAALTAANSAIGDVEIALFTDCGSSGDEREFNNANNHKITLDFGDCTLTGKNVISSQVEFLSSGSGCAENTGNVVLVNAGGNFSMTGSSLTSTSTSSDASAAPLAVYGTSDIPSASATLDGVTLKGYTSYGAAYVSYGSLTVGGSSQFSSYRAFFVTLGGRLTVNGGSFSGTGSASGQAIHVGATTGVDIDINGGTFSANTDLFSFNSAKASTASICITGGNFSWNGSFSGSYTGSGVSISGGLFSQALSYGVKSGYSCVDNTDPATYDSYPYMVKKDE